MTTITTQEQAALTSAEQQLLQQHERTIERGLQTFYAVGQALVSIREQRLYRVTHSTFETYCAERWGISDRHARRLISVYKSPARILNGSKSSRQSVSVCGQKSPASGRNINAGRNMIDAHRLLQAGEAQQAKVQAQRFRAHPHVAGYIGAAITGMQRAMEGSDG